MPPCWSPRSGIGGVIFLVVLIVVHLITSRISDSVLDSRVGAIDRILGLAFGVARGFVLVVIPFMFYEAFVHKPEQQYPWVRDAVSRPYIKSTGDSLRVILERPRAALADGTRRATAGPDFQDDNNAVARCRWQARASCPISWWPRGNEYLSPVAAPGSAAARAGARGRHGLRTR